ncbi:NUDIX hydrolase [Robertmurraya kyonggiensis]|uniref:NUDIX domain-containing protein n=1 Tax=Robertmurraya kyonggiensis TaxID=1037680 RepID=A0A4U1D0S3_9BACI|nr:NUDIX hydrolase [Robertmurraya kyonggiensis]TKC15751.1 NUDIX domain-containing protein [Robertmurraya kyonggiensis]
MTGYTKEKRDLIGTRPFILVGATIIVKNERNEILFQHRSDTFEWGLPGGAMEPGESLVETAERELYEETGLKAKSFKFVDVLSGKDLYFKYPNGDEVYNVICVYIAENINGELAINDDESIELKYFPINELPSKLDERARIVLEKYFL